MAGSWCLARLARWEKRKTGAWPLFFLFSDFFREHQQKEGGKTQDFILPEHKTDDGQDKRANEPQLKAKMKDRVRIEVPDLRNREPRWKTEANDE